MLHNLFPFQKNQKMAIKNIYTRIYRVDSSKKRKWKFYSCDIYDNILKKMSSCNKF
jgi:hypothetical protein